MVVVDALGMDNRLHALPGLHGQNIHHGGPLGGLARLRNLVALLAVDLPGVGEEENKVVRGRREHVRYYVLLAGRDSAPPHAAARLPRVLADGRPLDVARLRQREYALLFFD